jgi:hypothetical protein
MYDKMHAQEGFYPPVMLDDIRMPVILKMKGTD